MQNAQQVLCEIQEGGSTFAIMNHVTKSFGTKFIIVHVEQFAIV